MHLAALLTELRPDTDVDYLVDALLAVLSSWLFRHQRHELGFSTDRIKTGLDQLLADVTPSQAGTAWAPGCV